MNDIIKLFNLKDEDLEEKLFVADKDGTYYCFITLKRKAVCCPRCNSNNIVIESYRHRKINHPIFNTGKCIIVYKCRRYKCKSCHNTFNEDNSFVTRKNCHSKYAIALVLDSLKNPRETYTSIAKKCCMSVTNVINIFDSLGKINRNKFPEVLCIDEYYDPASGIGKYNCVFLDFITGDIIDILPDRTKNYLRYYLQNIPKTELLSVKHVSIDMWEPYKDTAKLYFRNAIISVDSYHVINHLIDAITSVRIKTMKRYETFSDEYYLLKKFNYLLTLNYNNLSYYEPNYNRRLKQYLNAFSTLELILKIDPILSLAYELKEEYIRINSSCTFENIDKYLRDYINKCRLSFIDEFIAFSNLLSHWFEEIVNSFIRINGKRISNGPMESMNSKIRIITNNSCGMNNFLRERNRVMYCFNSSKSIIYSNSTIIKRKMKKRK